MNINIKERECQTCGVGAGQIHASDACDEQCPYCGLLLGNCKHEMGSIPLDDRIPYDGYFPGYADCVRLGLYAKMVTGRGWVPCDADDPQGFPDINTLYATCKWNRDEKRWERHHDAGSTEETA